MADPVAVSIANHPFRYVNGCGENSRTIFTPDGGVTIYIGCSVYTPDEARNAIARRYADRPELMVKYLSAVDRLVNDDTPFDPEQFNWEVYSDELVRHTPQYFDPDRYNWEAYSWAVVKYAPQYFDAERYNWADYSGSLVQYAPQYFDPERYNWEDASAAVVKYAPEIYAQYKDRIVTNNTN
jgi:hypothetical protein